MSVNYGLAPRSGTCWVCKNVAAPEDVTLRLIDEQGHQRPIGDAVDYVRGIGHDGTSHEWSRRFGRHRAHVWRSMKNGPPPITPAHLETGKVTRVDPLPGSPSWVRAPDRAIALGMTAMDSLEGRIDDMEDAELVQLARLGITAAGKVGDWVAKGRKLDQIDLIARLASGFVKSD